MQLSIIEIMDIVGTIAFAISGAMVAADNKMDIFGVNFLAIVTATGGGICRDLIVGNTPPLAFRDPRYVILAAVTANLIFLIQHKHRHVSQSFRHFYEKTLFYFDTLGLAAFTVDGIFVGVDAGYGENGFLLIFLGLLTGVGGGLMRDVFANRTPDVLRKQVYATASVAGGIVTVLLRSGIGHDTAAVLAGVLVIVVIRLLAAHFRWNLPRI